MGNALNPEAELERLASFHEQIARLREKVKDLKEKESDVGGDSSRLTENLASGHGHLRTAVSKNY